MRLVHRSPMPMSSSSSAPVPSPLPKPPPFPGLPPFPESPQSAVPASSPVPSIASGRTPAARSSLRRLALLALPVVVGGCMLQPTYERPAAPVAATFPSGGVYDRQPDASSPASHGHSAERRAAVDIGWRDFFVDPRLQQLIAIALQNNRDLRLSMLNVEAARAQFQIARAQFYPTLGAGASLSRQRVPRDLAQSGRTITGEYTVGLTTSWEIDFFGRIRSLRDQALAQYFSLAQTRKAAQIALVAQVADQYLALRADDDQLAVTRDTLKNAQESYRINKLSFDTGVGTELDLRQAEGLVEQAQANLQAQQRIRAQDENALTLLIGQPLPPDLPAGRSLDAQDLLSDVPAGLPSDLLTRRPDIVAAEEALRAANASIGAARAAFFPRITLTGQVGTVSPSLSGLFKPGSAAWSFAPQITLPIFTAGANQANLDLAQIQKRADIATYEKAIQTAFREVADGLAARGTYDGQISALERNTQSQRRRLTLSEFRYKNGVDDYLSVLTAQTALYSARQLMISARLQRATNLVNLYKALGGGWIERTGDAPLPADTPPEQTLRRGS